MITIYKYEIAIAIIQAIRLPKGATILSLQIDQKNYKPYIWVEVNTEEKEEEARSFSIVGTGTCIHSENRSYIGTVQDDGLVWHLFENLKEDKE